MEQMKGVKHDGDKLRYDLIPPRAIEDFVRVLTFGAKKYAPDNWRKVENAEDRYFAAAQRHLWAWKMGEETDDETGISHLAHAMCCMAFLIDLAPKEKPWGDKPTAETYDVLVGYTSDFADPYDAIEEK